MSPKDQVKPDDIGAAACAAWLALSESRRRRRAPGIQDALKSTIRHLLKAQYDMTGNPIVSRIRRRVRTTRYLHTRRRVRGDFDLTHDHIDLALYATGRIKSLTYTMDPPGAAEDIRRAWLCLGQAAWGSDTAAITTLIRTLADDLAPIVVTMMRYGDSPALARAVGLTALAHQHLTTILDAISADPSPGLDLATTPIDLPPAGNVHELKKIVAEIRVPLQRVQQRIQDAAEDSPYHPGWIMERSMEGLTQAACHLTTADEEFGAWADRIAGGDCV